MILNRDCVETLRQQFEGQHELHIIDDRHLLGIKITAIDFLVNLFDQLDINTVVFHVGAKRSPGRYLDDAMAQINGYCEVHHIPTRDFVSLHTLLRMPLLDRDFVPTAGEWSEQQMRTMNRKARTVVRFMEKMKDKGIDVFYQYYANREFERLRERHIPATLPFGGNIWLASGNEGRGIGYFLDSGLNNLGRRVIQIQPMDDSSYGFTKDMFDNCVDADRQGHEPMDKDSIIRLVRTINGLHADLNN